MARAFRFTARACSGLMPLSASVLNSAYRRSKKSPPQQNQGHRIHGMEEMARLLRGGYVDEIRDMHRQGLSITDIAELTSF